MYAIKNDKLRTAISSELLETQKEILEEASKEGVGKEIEYLIDICGEGKRLRTVILYALYYGTTEKKTDALRFISLYLELIHNASLIHDDIIDQDKTRRKKENIYSRSGLNDALIKGDQMIFTACYVIQKFYQKNTDEAVINAVNILSSYYVKLCRGQMLEQKTIGNISLSMKQYMRIIEEKTAGFFENIAAAACDLAKVDEQLRTQYRKFGRNFGIAYQIRNDIKNLLTENNELDISQSSDLKRHLPTFPFLYAYSRANTEEKKYYEQYFKNEGDNYLYCIRDAWQREDYLEKCKKFANGYLDRAKRNLKNMPNDGIRTEMELLIEYLRL